MNISYIYSGCVKHDAISNCIRDEIAALHSSNVGRVQLYAYECQHENIPFRRVSSVTNVVFDGHFQSSSLVVFHFGIYYPLFDLLPVVPKRTKTVVVFHNITPKEFTSAENHAVIDRSFAQLSNICWADYVICDSETNLAALRSLDIHVPASVVPVAVSVGTPPAMKPSFADGVIRITFVGRFVQSKGVLDLLAALPGVLGDRRDLHVRLDLIGNMAFSDKKVIQQVRLLSDQIEGDCGSRVQIFIHGDAPEQTKRDLLLNSDLFVLPTYHEGFCVPIVEALASGCRVIAYENSNTPAISAGFATLTPTGDQEQLARAMRESLEQVHSAEWKGTGPGSYAEYAGRVHAYTQNFAPRHVGERFVSLVRKMTIS